MDQVTGRYIYRYVVSTSIGRSMTGQTRGNITYQCTVIAGMTGSRVVTGGRTVVGRCGDRVSCVVMDRGLAVSSTRMTRETGSDYTYHAGCIAITAGADPSRVIRGARVGMTECAVVVMDTGNCAVAAVGMTVNTVINYR